jgi:acyl-coenzyme A thioesterase PaaI-like protein
VAKLAAGNRGFDKDQSMTEALRTYAECFVCGESNPAGLHAAFSLGDAPDEMRGRFTPDGRYQGYPGRVHGGVVASVLDETLGRAVALHGAWAFTARLEVRYRRPVPVGAAIEVRARQVRDRGRFVEARGEARLLDGEVVAEATGLFLKLAPEETDALRAAIWPEEAGGGQDRDGSSYAEPA